MTLATFMMPLKVTHFTQTVIKQYFFNSGMAIAKVKIT